MVRYVVSQQIVGLLPTYYPPHTHFNNRVALKINQKDSIKITKQKKGKLEVKGWGEEEKKSKYYQYVSYLIYCVMAIKARIYIV